MKFLAVPALLALCGCAAAPDGTAHSFEAEFPPPGLQLATGPDPARAGGVADLSLRNGAATSVGYNLCMAALERSEGGLWVPARSIAANCPQAFQPLGAGQAATGQAALPGSLEPGVYRFVTQLSGSSENLPDVQLRGEPFRVAAD